MSVERIIKDLKETYCNNLELYKHVLTIAEDKPIFLGETSLNGVRAHYMTILPLLNSSLLRIIGKEESYFFNTSKLENLSYDFGILEEEIKKEKQRKKREEIKSLKESFMQLFENVKKIGAVYNKRTSGSLMMKFINYFKEQGEDSGLYWRLIEYGVYKHYPKANLYQTTCKGSEALKILKEEECTSLEEEIFEGIDTSIFNDCKLDNYEEENKKIKKELKKLGFNPDDYVL